MEAVWANASKCIYIWLLAFRCIVGLYAEIFYLVLSLKKSR